MAVILPPHAQDTWGFGCYPVTQIDHYMIEMPDGVKLAAKIWYPFESVKTSCFEGHKHQLFYQPKDSPQKSEDEKFPVIMEYLPYRKSDWTAARDYRRHPWFSSHGYVVVRVDLRGSGDSEGVYFDEYAKQEQDDCIAVMDWISKQPWSNQNVGMIGKSWGGFNGLQLAYRQPPQLKAVISLYSTDDRYIGDIHYDDGGCIIGDGMLSWNSVMYNWNARAPDPRNCPNWKQMWKNRLEKAAKPWSKIWLSHQLRDEYWRQGSICEDYSRVTCPILAIGGWRDAYRDYVFTMVEHLPNIRGIIGPWSHEWPDVATPGPNIEYLKVCLQWFDQHLKGIDNNVMSEPKLRLYLQTHVPPRPGYDNRPGKWIAVNDWPTKEVDERVFYVNTNIGLMAEKHATKGDWIKVPCHMGAGISRGLWLDFGGPWDHSNQCHADGHSLRFTTEVLTSELPLVGRPKLTCNVRVMNHKQAMLAVRLVVLSPTGESTLITYGQLNLTHALGHTKDKVKDLIPGEIFGVTVDLHSTTYVVPEGHRLMIGLSSAMWPGAWPSSKVTDVEVKDLKLAVPVIKDDTVYNSPLFDSKNPTIGPPLPTKILGSSEHHGIFIEQDLTNRKFKRKIIGGSPKTLLEPLGVVKTENDYEVYEITEDEPLSANILITRDFTLEYPKFEGGTVTKVCTESSMSADENKFHLTNKLKTWINGELFHQDECEDYIERNFC